MSADPVDRMMEEASLLLVKRDYLACERLCLQALESLRRQEDFERYARVLLPLQEARRQRRQIAVEAGVVILGPPRRDPQEVLAQHTQGCLLLLDPPWTGSDVAAMRRGAFEQGLYMEFLLQDQEAARESFEFLMEQEGHRRLAAVAAGLDPVARLDALFACVQETADHEIAHQRLADAARIAASSRTVSG